MVEIWLEIIVKRQFVSLLFFWTHFRYHNSVKLLILLPLRANLLCILHYETPCNTYIRRCQLEDCVFHNFVTLTGVKYTQICYLRPLLFIFLYVSKKVHTSLYFVVFMYTFRKCIFVCREFGKTIYCIGRNVHRYITIYLHT